jgi:hypothetical protein
MPSNRTASATALPSIAPLPTADPRPADDDAWKLRRLRVVARRRVRVSIAAIGTTAQIASDGELVVVLETVQERDPRVIGWRANREVDLVVVHDGCGARAVGAGGVAGRIELPAALGADAFLAFCYDTEPGPAGI